MGTHRSPASTLFSRQPAAANGTARPESPEAQAAFIAANIHSGFFFINIIFFLVRKEFYHW